MGGGDGGSDGDGARGRNQRVGGNPAGEWGVIVDVEFQEMEKGVGDFRDGAVDILEPPKGVSRLCLEPWRGEMLGAGTFLNTKV